MSGRSLISLNSQGPIYKAGGVLDDTLIQKKLAEDFGVKSYKERTTKLLSHIENPTAWLEDKAEEYEKASNFSALTFKRHFNAYKDQGIPEGDAIVLAEQAAYRDFKNRKALVDLEYPDAAGDFAMRTATQGQIGLNDIYGASGIGNSRKQAKAAKRKARGKAPRSK